MLVPELVFRFLEASPVLILSFEDQVLGNRTGGQMILVP